MAEIIPGNDVTTTLSSSINNSQTSFDVANASAMPSTGNFRIRIDNEIMTVTGISGNTLTVTRATESINGVTLATSHNMGATVVLVVTKAQLDSLMGIYYAPATGNTSLTNANTEYAITGSTLSLPKGTYLLYGVCSIGSPGGNVHGAAYIYNGATQLCAGLSAAPSGYVVRADCGGLITFASDATLTLKARCDIAGSTVAQSDPYGGAGIATYMFAKPANAL